MDSRAFRLHLMFIYLVTKLLFLVLTFLPYLVVTKWKIELDCRLNCGLLVEEPELFGI
jgi:hypothetical protein